MCDKLIDWYMHGDFEVEQSSALWANPHDIVLEYCCSAILLILWHVGRFLSDLRNLSKDPREGSDVYNSRFDAKRLCLACDPCLCPPRKLNLERTSAKMSIYHHLSIDSVDIPIPLE